MKISRTDRLLVGAAALALIAGLPAIGQDRPESLLPPGFSDPVAPAPSPSPTPRPFVPGVPAPSGAIVQPLPATPTPTPSPTPAASPTPTPADLAALRRYELPDIARRSTDYVGIAGSGSSGYGAQAYGDAGGVWLERLMRRLDAPLPSRWLSIALRRALAAEVATPGGIGGADFAAERAWLLIRMGEAPAARALVQGVDIDNYTPKLFQVAMQAMLATADPGGLCPLVGPATAVSNERGWRLAAAMCAGLSGESRQAGALLSAGRRGIDARGIDTLLAEKVVGAGAQGRRAVTIEWDGTDRLSAWRWGLATATGVAVPADLFATVGPQVRLWNALSPAIAPGDRLADADLAAAQGVLSSQALLDLYGQVGSEEDASSAQAAIATDLRTAFTARSATERLTVLRQLWSDPTTPRLRYARQVLTARAAAAIPPAADRADDADALIGSMLSAGLDLRAIRWGSVAAPGSDGWAMLTVASPRGRLIDAEQVGDYAARAPVKGRMLLAGLAGLGRIGADDAAALAADLDMPMGTANAWTRAIDLAGERREPGSVLLLAAIGMQTREWSGVPPIALLHIVAALRAAGLEGEARMIAAEAIARA